VYHLELRQFPHNLCRFNLGEQELQTLVEPWAHDQWIEVGGRKWSPHEARMTILDGPRLAVQELSMGRGWRNAQRRSEDVTDRVLAAAKVQAGGPSPREPATDLSLQADSLGLELLTALAHAPASLSAVWELARSRLPEHSPSQCLAVAEQVVRSLLRRELIVLAVSLGEDQGRRHAAEQAGHEPGESELEQLLRAPGSWCGGDQQVAILVRRA
jgi:hypothetical protein